MRAIRIILLSLLFVVGSGCNGQTKKGNAKNTIVSEDTLNKPRVDVIVNKQYDAKGRVIKYDSTYSYTYAGPTGSLQSGNDSIYSGFRAFFERSYPNYLDRQNDNIFFNDSLFKYDFFNDDYFHKRFELNQKMIENMYIQMDSIKRNFLKRNYPNGQQRIKTK